GKRRWAFPFKVFGMNAIAAFVAASVVTRVANLIKVYDGGERIGLLGYLKRHTTLGIQNASTWLQHHLGTSLPNVDQNASLAYALEFVLIIWLLIVFMYAI